VNLNEVAGEIIEGNGSRVILCLAGESIRQASVTAHPTANGPVLALYVACRDVFGFGISAHFANLDTHAFRRRVTGFIL